MQLSDVPMFEVWIPDNSLSRFANGFLDRAIAITVHAGSATASRRHHHFKLPQVLKPLSEAAALHQASTDDKIPEQEPA